MKDIIIQTENPASHICVVIRLQTRPSGDVELVSSKSCEAEYANMGRGVMMSPGGVSDSLIALIPKSKRCEVAQFLTEA